MGFDQIKPYEPITIISWMYDFAFNKVDLIDNRAQQVPCYHPGYTFVEKMQAISSKFRKEQKEGVFSPNFLRHYYDLYQLLDSSVVTKFIGTKEYNTHKEKRFGQSNIKNITQNQAFLLEDSKTFGQYQKQYEASSTLYYQKTSTPSFDEIISRLREWAPKL